MNLEQFTKENKAFLEKVPVGVLQSVAECEELIFFNRKEFCIDKNINRKDIRQGYEDVVMLDNLLCKLNKEYQPNNTWDIEINVTDSVALYERNGGVFKESFEESTGRYESYPVSGWLWEDCVDSTNLAYHVDELQWGYMDALKKVEKDYGVMFPEGFHRDENSDWNILDETVALTKAYCELKVTKEKSRVSLKPKVKAEKEAGNTFTNDM